MKLVDGNPNDPSNGLWRFGLYFLYKGLGDSVDNPKEAREYYNQALRESTRLAKEDAKDYPGLDPQSLRWQSLIDLADMNRNEGNEDQKNHKEQEAKALWKDARDLYQEALPVALKLAQSQPPGDIADADQWQDANQQTLWVSYMMLGTMEQDAHDKRRWYEKAMGLATSRYQNEQKAAARKPAQEQQGKKHPSESQAKKDLEKTLDALRRLDRAGKK